MAASINGVSFSVANSADIRHASVLSLKGQTLSRKAGVYDPTSNNIADARLGAIGATIVNRDEVCRTCGHNVKSCKGHDSHIELGFIYHNPDTNELKETLRLLEITCQVCSADLINKGSKDHTPDQLIDVDPSEPMPNLPVWCITKLQSIYPKPDIRAQMLDMSPLNTQQKAFIASLELSMLPPIPEVVPRSEFKSTREFAEQKTVYLRNIALAIELRDKIVVIPKQHTHSDIFEAETERWYLTRYEVDNINKLQEIERVCVCSVENVFMLRSCLHFQILSLIERQSEILGEVPLPAHIVTKDTTSKPDLTSTLTSGQIEMLKVINSQIKTCEQDLEIVNEVVQEIRRITAALLKAKLEEEAIAILDHETSGKKSKKNKRGADRPVHLIDTKRFNHAYRYKLTGEHVDDSLAFLEITTTKSTVLNEHGYALTGQVCCNVAFGGCGASQHRKYLDGVRFYATTNFPPNYYLWRIEGPFDTPEVDYLDRATILRIHDGIPSADLKSMMYNPSNSPGDKFKCVAPAPNPVIIPPVHNYNFAKGCMTNRGPAASINEDIIAVELKRVVKICANIREMRTSWETEYGRLMILDELFKKKTRSKLESDFVQAATDAFNLLSACITDRPKYLPHLPPFANRARAIDITTRMQALHSTCFKVRLNSKDGTVSQTHKKHTVKTSRTVLTCNSSLSYKQIGMGMKPLRNLFIVHAVTSSNILALQALVDHVQERRKELSKLKYNMEMLKIEAQQKGGAFSVAVNTMCSDLYRERWDVQYDDVWPTVGVVFKADGSIRNIHLRASERLEIGDRIEASIFDYVLMNRPPSLSQDSFGALEVTCVTPDIGKVDVWNNISYLRRQQLGLIPTYVKIKIEDEQLRACERKARIDVDDDANTLRLAEQLIAARTLSSQSEQYQQLVAVGGKIDLRIPDDDPTCSVHSSVPKRRAGDCDGDCVFEHYPQEGDARAEAKLQLGEENCTINVKSGTTGPTLIQDVIVGWFFMFSNAAMISLSEDHMLSGCLQMSRFRSHTDGTMWRDPEMHNLRDDMFTSLERFGRAPVHDSITGEARFGVHHLLFFILPVGFCYNRDNKVVITNGWLETGIPTKVDMGEGEISLPKTIYHDFGRQAITDFFDDMAKVAIWWNSRNCFSYSLVDLIYHPNTYEQVQAASIECDTKEVRAIADLKKRIDTLERKVTDVLTTSTITHVYREFVKDRESLIDETLTTLSIERDNAQFAAFEKAKMCSLDDCPLIQRLLSRRHPLCTLGKTTMYLTESGARGSSKDLFRIMLVLGVCTVNGKILPVDLGTYERVLPSQQTNRWSVRYRGTVNQGYMQGLNEESLIFAAMNQRYSLAMSSCAVYTTGVMQQTLLRMLSQYMHTYNGTTSDEGGRMAIFQDTGTSCVYETPVRVHLLDYIHQVGAADTTDPKVLEKILESKWKLGHSDTTIFQDLCKLLVGWLKHIRECATVFGTDALVFRLPFDIDHIIVSARQFLDNNGSDKDSEEPITASNITQAWNTVSNLRKTIQKGRAHFQGIADVPQALREFYADWVIDAYIACQLCPINMVAKYELTMQQLVAAGRLIQERFVLSRIPDGWQKGCYASSSMGSGTTQATLNTKRMAAGLVISGAPRLIHLYSLTLKAASLIVSVQLKPDANTSEEYWIRNLKAMVPSNIFIDYGYCEDEDKDLMARATTDDISFLPEFSRFNSDIDPEVPCMRFIISKAALAYHGYRFTLLMGLFYNALPASRYIISVWETKGNYIVYTHEEEAQRVPVPELDLTIQVPENKKKAAAMVPTADVMTDSSSTPLTQEPEPQKPKAKRQKREVKTGQQKFHEKMERAIEGVAQSEIKKSETKAKLKNKRIATKRKSTRTTVEEDPPILPDAPKPPTKFVVGSRKLELQLLASTIVTECVPSTGIADVQLNAIKDPVTGKSSHKLFIRLIKVGASKKTSKQEVATVTSISGGVATIKKQAYENEGESNLSKYKPTRLCYLFAQPEFDIAHSYSSIVNMTFPVFGLGASIQTLIREQYDALQGFGHIAHEHLILIAVWMCLTGNILPMSRQSLYQTCQCPLEQSMFQTKKEVLSWAALRGLTSTLNLVSSGMVGREELRLGPFRSDILLTPYD